MKITKDAILSTLPVVLAEDREMRALADPIAEALAARVPEIDLIRLFSRIDELPEDLLDILAYDFKADWWEYDATLEEKRAVFKKIWYVHRHKGTKASVETAIGALAHYISDESVGSFQPMNVNFGIMDPLGYRVRGKANRNLAIAERALAHIDAMNRTKKEKEEP